MAVTSTPATLAEQWSAIATVALLGADRRLVPAALPGPIADLVEGVRPAGPAEMLMTQAAALTTIRRAGVRPGPVLPPLLAPLVDTRPVCPTQALDRLGAILAEWPELTGEWLGLVRAGGWRLPGDIAAGLLARFRGVPAMRATVAQLTGDTADWLAELFPDALAPRGPQRPPAGGEAVPPGRPIDMDPATIVAGLESGELTPRHRSLLIHAVCSYEPALLAPLAAGLARAGTNPNTMGLALSLADLARTRYEMILELTP